MLDRLGVLKAVDQAGAQPLRGMRIVAPDGTALVGAYPTSGPWRGYRDHALAIPREVLDRDPGRARARACPWSVRGAPPRDGSPGRLGTRRRSRRRRTPDGRRLEIAARLVVGADGRASVVAASLGLVRPHRSAAWRSISTWRDSRASGDRGEIYVDPPDYAILNPVAPGLRRTWASSCRWPTRRRGAAGSRPSSARGSKQLRHLAPRLAGMEPAGRLMAMGPLAYRVDEPRVGGVLLVGDAAGFYDPFTGEGLFTALRSAELARRDGACGARSRRSVRSRRSPPYARARAPGVRAPRRA